MNALTADKGPTSPRERILRAVQTGIVLSSVGGGCLALSDMFQYEASDLFTVAGVILLSLGIGFLRPQAPPTASASAWAYSSRNLGVDSPVYTVKSSIEDVCRAARGHRRPGRSRIARDHG